MNKGCQKETTKVNLSENGNKRQKKREGERDRKRAKEDQKREKLTKT